MTYEVCAYTVSVCMLAVCLLSGLCETACEFVPVCVRP